MIVYLRKCTVISTHNSIESDQPYDWYKIVIWRYGDENKVQSPIQCLKLTLECHSRGNFLE